jgi:tetratricopeptide (TPR) repeat protein
MANILCSQALRLTAVGQTPMAEEKLHRALKALEGFRPEFGHDQEVADGIRAKTFRLLGDWSSAFEAVKKYEDTDNPFTLYERCKVYLEQLRRASSEERYQAALDSVRVVIKSVSEFAAKQRLSSSLEEVLEEARTWQRNLERI